MPEVSMTQEQAKQIVKLLTQIAKSVEEIKDCVGYKAVSSGRRPSAPKESTKKIRPDTVCDRTPHIVAITRLR